MVKYVDGDFRLLQNPCIPDQCQPRNYNFHVYSRAILWYKGLHNRDDCGDVDVCVSCHHELVSLGKQPLDLLANFQYYAHEALPNDVHNAFH